MPGDRAASETENPRTPETAAGATPGVEGGGPAAPEGGRLVQ